MSTERTTFQKIKLVTGLIILGLAVTIIIQNLKSVEVNLLFWTVNISLFILTSLNLLAGFILGWFFISRKHKKQNVVKTQVETNNKNQIDATIKG